MSSPAGRVLRLSQHREVQDSREGIRLAAAARREGGGRPRHGVWRLRRRFCALCLRDEPGQYQGSDGAAAAVHWEVVTLLVLAAGASSKLGGGESPGDAFTER